LGCKSSPFSLKLVEFTDVVVLGGARQSHIRVNYAESNINWLGTINV